MLYSRAEVKEYPQVMRIFQEGTPNNHLWRIHKGIVHLSFQGQTFAKLDQNDIFGAEALLGETKAPYSADSHGIEGVVVYKIPAFNVLQLFGYQPVLAFRFYGNFSVDLANKFVLDLFQISMQKLSSKEMKGKLARSIAAKSSFKKNISSVAQSKKIYTTESGAMASYECSSNFTTGVLHVFPDHLLFQEKKNQTLIKFSDIKSLEQNWRDINELTSFDFTVHFSAKKETEKIIVRIFFLSPKRKNLKLHFLFSV